MLSVQQRETIVMATYVCIDEYLSLKLEEQSLLFIVQLLPFVLKDFAKQANCERPSSHDSDIQCTLTAMILVKIVHTEPYSHRVIPISSD